MSASVEVKGLAELQKSLAKLSEKGLKAVSREVATEGQRLVGACFSSGTAPDGTPWAPLAVRDGQPLRDTGRLAASVVAQDTGAGFTIGTNVAYAGVHQHGAVISVKHARQLYSKKLGMGFGKSVKIPARPFLPGDSLPPAWAASIREVIEDAVEALVPGGS
jgi:phage virion morphogenesis protein